MTLSSEEKAALIGKAFGEAARRYQKFCMALIFLVGLSSGVMGAYFGIRPVLMVYGLAVVWLVVQSLLHRFRGTALRRVR